MKLPLLTICLTLVAAAAQASDVNLTADQKVEWHQKARRSSPSAMPLQPRTI